MALSAIFDIDGTLADATHRLHHVTKPPKNWGLFFAQAEHDPLHAPIRDLAARLYASGLNIILVSGRTDDIRGLTESWLKRHDVHYSVLHMRPAGDYRPDYVVKEEILDKILAEGHEILLTVDDRPSVVEMWRRRGITCLQCRDWDESVPAILGLLTIMVGPSCAGKSTWLASPAAADLGIHSSHIISSDQIRCDLCGNAREQSKNEEVFKALHAMAKTRLSNGLPCVIDATNIKRKDRLACVALANGARVRYIVLDRPLQEKQRDAEWRSLDVIAKHDQTFKSQIKDILSADHQLNVNVIDLRGPP